VLYLKVNFLGTGVGLRPIAYNPTKRGPLTARPANDLSRIGEQNRALGGLRVRWRYTL